MGLCPHCTMAGLAGYLGWLWKAQGRDAMHIFVFHSDLREMLRLRREVFAAVQLSQTGGNIDVAFFGPYVHETTLGLVLKMFSYIRRSDGLNEEGRSILAELLGAADNKAALPLTLYAVTGKPGQAFNMHSLKEFSRLTDLYRLYESWINAVTSDNPEHTIENVFRQFQKKEGSGYNTIWRDKICQAVLDFKDPLSAVEQFLYEARVKEETPRSLSWGSEAILGNYTKEVLGMENDLIEVLKGFGHSLGHRARDENEMGLLYSLRNSRNLDEFYRVLNDIQFQLEMTVPEQLLKAQTGEKIADNPWARVKSLLSIYAMNSYLWAGKNKEGGN